MNLATYTTQVMKAYDSYLMLKLPLCGNKWTKTIEKKREIQNSDGINRPHSQTLVSALLRRYL